MLMQVYLVVTCELSRRRITCYNKSVAGREDHKKLVK